MSKLPLSKWITGPTVAMLLAALAAASPVASAVEPPSTRSTRPAARSIDQMLGVSTNHRSGPNRQRKAYAQLPTGTARVSVHGIKTFYNVDDPGLAAAERPMPESMDEFMKVAFEAGQYPAVNIISTPKHDKVPFDEPDWYEVGRAFAERFQVGSAWNRANTSADWGADTYMLFNEIDGNWYHYDDASKDRHLDMFRQIHVDFARGVRAAQPDAKVYIGPLAVGHARKGEYSAREWVKRCADLFLTDGPERLDGFGLQTYVNAAHDEDATQRKLDVQSNYDDICAYAGITEANPDFYSTEFNVQLVSARQGSKADGDRTYIELAEDVDPADSGDVARTLLTLIWNKLSVVRPNGPRAGEPATQFALPFSVFDNGRGQWVALVTDPDWKDTFTLNKRGLVLVMVATLGKGLVIDSIDPDAGLTVASDGDATLWAWTNLPGHTNIAGGTGGEIELADVPPTASSIEIYYWDSATESGVRPATVVELETHDAWDPERRAATITGLRSGETIMFLAR